MRVGGPKAAKRPRTERATYQLTLNTLKGKAALSVKGKTPRSGHGPSAPYSGSARRLAPPREARSGPSRRKSDFISKHKGPQHPVGVGDRAGAFRPALDLIHGLHTNQHLANDGILAIKERPVFEHDEELGIG